MTDVAVYTGLLASAFLAATIFPAQSEAGLAYLVAMGEQPVGLLVLVASAGNTAGAVVNWYLGGQLGRFSDRRWFPANKTRLAAATSWYQKYGYWSLLASWMPIIGDPITLVAGFFRAPLWSFVVIVGLAKTVRYLVVVLMTWQFV
jgi:membrane protein YqaA with SNARE-associated domain